MPETPPEMLMTPAEHQVLADLGQVWNDLCAVVGHDEDTRGPDLRELVIHIHALQHAVMAQAAARAHPELYRGLGGRI